LALFLVIVTGGQADLFLFAPLVSEPVVVLFHGYAETSD
jgi:hypothetical protein